MLFIYRGLLLAKLSQTCPLPPMSYGAENVQEQRERVERLEKLYQESGRAKEGHPLRGLFTGLFRANLPK